MADLNAWNGIGPRDDTSPVAGYLWWHAKFYFAPIIVVIAFYLVALATAKQFAVNASYGGIGSIMLGLQFMILLVGFMWGNIGLAAIAGYTRGQIGGIKEGKEEGPSIEDGVKGAQEWSIGFKNFWLGMAHFAAIPFLTLMLLAWAGPESVHKYSGTLLTISFAALIAVSWLSSGKFVASLFMVIEVIALVALLGFIVKEGIDRRFVVAQAASAAQRTADEKARDDAKKEVAQVIQNMRKTCYDALAKKAKDEGKIAPTAEFDKCAAIGVETTPVVSAPATGTADQVNGAASKPAPAAPTAAAAPQLDPACTDLIREVEYSPGKSLGGVNLGPVTSGRYQILVTGDIEQAFLDTDGKVIMYCPVSPEGKLSACRTPEGHPVGNIPGRPWTDLPAPPAPAGQLLVPGEAYGAAVVHMLGKPLVYYPKMFVEVAEKSHLVADSNVYQNDKNYQGTGVRKYQVFKCSSANS
ncbi:MAG: hypothetical protein WBP40_04900 [Candidatus Moraniibacteriota bacterium]